MRIIARQAFTHEGVPVQAGDSLDVVPRVAVSLVSSGLCTLAIGPVQHRDPVPQRVA